MGQHCITVQALVLNLAVFISGGAGARLILIVILIPVVCILWALLGWVAVVLPMSNAPAD